MESYSYEPPTFWDTVNPFLYWSEGDSFAAVFFGLCWVTILYVAFLIGRAIYRKIHWYRHRQPCQHCTGYTLDESTGEFPSCLAGDACCYGCLRKHQADAEPKHVCPRDGTTWDKVVDGELTLDHCPACGHWNLADEELTALRQRSYDKGYAAGKSNGQISGAAVGYVVGSMGD